MAALQGSQRFHVGAAVAAAQAAGVDKLFNEDGSPVDPKGERWQSLLPAVLIDFDASSSLQVKRNLGQALAQRVGPTAACRGGRFCSPLCSTPRQARG